MQVIIQGVAVEADILDVVRLVASSRGIIDVDLEPYDSKVTLKYDGNTLTGKTKDIVCNAFLRAQL